MAQGQGGKYTLEIPLDASGIEGFKPDQPIKVIAIARDVPIASEVVRLDAKGHVRARLVLPGRPGAIRVAVGSADATDGPLTWTPGFTPECTSLPSGPTILSALTQRVRRIEGRCPARRQETRRRGAADEDEDDCRECDRVEQPHPVKLRLNGAAERDRPSSRITAAHTAQLEQRHMLSAR